MKNRLAHIALVTMALMLAGCSLAETVQTKLFDSKVNLTDSTYAAADMLAPQAKSRITQNTPIRLAVLTDVATPNEATPFGTQLANQLGARFVQLGYNVQSVPMPPGAMNMVSGAPALLSAEIVPAAPKISQGAVKPSLGQGGECIVGGTYTRLQDTIQVSLRIVQAPDQRIIAAYDYTLPLTQELRELSLTSAERTRKEQGWFPTFSTRSGPTPAVKVQSNPPEPTSLSR